MVRRPLAAVVLALFAALALVVPALPAAAIGPSLPSVGLPIDGNPGCC